MSYCICKICNIHRFNYCDNICLSCFGIKYYKGLKQRVEPLTDEQVRKNKGIIK